MGEGGRGCEGGQRDRRERAAGATSDARSRRRCDRGASSSASGRAAPTAAPPHTEVSPPLHAVGLCPTPSRGVRSREEAVVGRGRHAKCGKQHCSRRRKNADGVVPPPAAWPIPSSNPPHSSLRLSRSPSWRGLVDDFCRRCSSATSTARDAPDTPSCRRHIDIRGLVSASESKPVSLWVVSGVGVGVRRWPQRKQTRLAVPPELGIGRQVPAQHGRHTRQPRPPPPLLMSPQGRGVQTLSPGAFARWRQGQRRGWEELLPQTLTRAQNARLRGAPKETLAAPHSPTRT